LWWYPVAPESCRLLDALHGASMAPGRVQSNEDQSRLPSLRVRRPQRNVPPLKLPKQPRVESVSAARRNTGRRLRSSPPPFSSGTRIRPRSPTPVLRSRTRAIARGFGEKGQAPARAVHWRALPSAGLLLTRIEEFLHGRPANLMYRSLIAGHLYQKRRSRLRLRRRCRRTHCTCAPKG